MANLISVKDLSKHFGTRTLFTEVSFTLYAHDRCALIGPNGGGKSTLMKILAGQEQADSGTVIRQKNTRVAYVSQQDTFADATTLRDAIIPPLLAMGKELYEADYEAERALLDAGFTDVEVCPTQLSGGWRKRLSLVRAFAQAPDLLLLDEPTNHLDLMGVAWLESQLKRYCGGIFFVSHDRQFLENSAKRVIELDVAYPGGTFDCDGNYTRFLEQKEVFLEAQEAQQRVLASQVRRDTAWLRQGIQGRQTRNKTQVVDTQKRMAAFTDVSKRNAGRNAAKIDFAETGRQANIFIEAEGVGKSFVADKKLFSNLDIVLAPGKRVGLLGDNGCGKSTLIKCLLGDILVDEGEIKRAHSLKVAHFSQHRDSLDPSQTLRDALLDGEGVGGDMISFRDRRMHVAGWAKMFQFRDDQLSTPVAQLSGGEQARVLMARLMLQECDILVLDEPTNDLDIPTLNVLEDALMSFPGAVLLVTHDRYMLGRVCDTLLHMGDEAGPDRYIYHYNMEQYQLYMREVQKREKELVTVSQKQGNAAPVSTPKAVADKPKRKLSFKEKYELEHMEEAIAKAEALADELEAQTMNASLQSDHGRLAEMYNKLGEAQSQVQRLYARWEELDS